MSDEPDPQKSGRITRSFCVGLPGYSTSVEVVEYADGDMLVALRTIREGMAPVETAMRLHPNTVYLLSTALHSAAHNPSIWNVVEPK